MHQNPNEEVWGMGFRAIVLAPIGARNAAGVGDHETLGVPNAPLCLFILLPDNWNTTAHWRAAYVFKNYYLVA